MPSYRTAKGLQLPAFKVGPQLTPPSAPQQLPDVQSTWRPSLDKLMTLSCRERGVSSILLSGFYDPSIECNAAAPWLQGSFSAIRLLTPESPAVLGRMLMDRQPNLSPLWAGATIIGLQDEVLRDAWRGMILLDLLSAASSETIQSFVQEPISDPLVVNGNISRSDQCRLLFFSRKEFHKRLPISPWKPFGENPVGDTDLEVQAHVQCKGHRLRYQGFTGIVRTGRRYTSHSRAETRSPQSGTAHIPTKHPSIMQVWTRTRSTYQRTQRGASSAGCASMAMHRVNGRSGSTNGSISVILTKRRKRREAMIVAGTRQNHRSTWKLGCHT